MFESTWKREADNDRLKTGDKTGFVASMIMTTIVAIFFFAHWTGDTGFFISEFNDLDAVIFVIAFFFSLLPVVMKLALGVKNRARPYDLISTLFFIVASIYFLCNFHFDMSVVAEPLPEGLRFLIDWLDEGWARIFLILGLLGGFISLAWTTLTYLQVKEILDRKA
jgi:hypothetical protein